jgi:hypothetical protein
MQGQTAGMPPIVRRIVNNPMSLFVAGAAIGAALGSAAVYWYGDRYDNHHVVQQMVPKKVLKQVQEGEPFEYPTLLVGDERGAPVYTGNTITLYDYPDSLVTLGTHGIETWRRNEVETARESVDGVAGNDGRPHIVMNAADGSNNLLLWVPYFLSCPIKSSLTDIEVRDWNFKHCLVSIDFPAQIFSIERLGMGGKVRKETTKELEYVDGDGHKRKLSFLSNVIKDQQAANQKAAQRPMNGPMMGPNPLGAPRPTVTPFQSKGSRD